MMMTMIVWWKKNDIEKDQEKNGRQL